MNTSLSKSRRFKNLRISLMLATSIWLFWGMGCLQITPLAQCFGNDDCKPNETCEAHICKNPFLAPVCSENCKTDNDCTKACDVTSFCIRETCYANVTWLTSSLSRVDSRKVDILFVVDNSGSMKEEQEKLSKGFDQFMSELTKKELKDIQIGVITTDTSNLAFSGVLQSKQGNPRIISSNNLSRSSLVEKFRENIYVGTTGSDFEKPLDAMRLALSEKYLNDPSRNQGFLRKDSLLAVIFITDEDDCSHDGNIDEKMNSGICAIPNDKILKGENGETIFGSDGKPLKGKLQNLIPVSQYISFLRGLNREIIATGLIGNPVVYKTNKKPLACTENSECNASQGHSCRYSAPNTQQCGGCKVQGANASPGFRLYELIKAFGGTESWHSICGDGSQFSQALIGIAQNIAIRREFITLHRPPLSGSLSRIKVELHNQKTQQKQIIKQAKALSPLRQCTEDSGCNGSGICGPDQFCYGDGWVYFSPLGGTKPTIKLSGTSKQAFTLETTLKVTYLTVQ